MTLIDKDKIHDKDVYQKLLKNNFFWKIKKESEDGHLTLVVTNNCNLWCKYCYENAWLGKTITFELAKAAIDDLAKKTNDPIKILFHWGEPTIAISLIKEIYDYIENVYADREYRMHLITNGVFSHETFKILKEINIAVTISCDWYPEIQDKNRPLKDWNNSSIIVENNIKNFINAWLPLQVMVIITDQTVNKMWKIIKYFHSLWVTRIRIEPLISEWRASYCSLNPPDWRIFADNFMNAIQLAKELGITLTHSSLFYIASPTYTFCSCGRWNNLTLLPDWRVALCHEINAANEYQIATRIIGRYDPKQKYIEIDRKKVNDFDKKVNVISNKSCSQCPVKRICWWWCPTRNMSGNNTLWWLNKNLCKMRQEIIKQCIVKMYKESIQ